MFWSFGIMDCMLFWFENRVWLGMLMVWHLSLPKMYSFNKTEVGIFPMHATLPEDSLFLSFIYCTWCKASSPSLSRSCQRILCSQHTARRTESRPPSSSVAMDTRRVRWWSVASWFVQRPVLSHRLYHMWSLVGSVDTQSIPSLTCNKNKLLF